MSRAVGGTSSSVEDKDAANFLLQLPVVADDPGSASSSSGGRPHGAVRRSGLLHLSVFPC